MQCPKMQVKGFLKNAEYAGYMVCRVEVEVEVVE